MRSLRRAAKNIRRSPFQAIAAVAVLTLTFFVVTVFVLVALGSQQVLRHFESKPQVIAYLKDEVTSQQTGELKNRLEQTPGVDSVKYVSKEEALAIYKESVGNDPLLLGTTNLSLVTADILPASLEIAAVSPEDFPRIVEVLKSAEAVDSNAVGEKDIDFPQSVVAELTAWTRGVRTAGLVLIGALALSSVIIIMILLSMKLAQRRLEISTVKLLGAGRGFIIFPYLYESLFYTISGAVFGWLLAYIGVLYATPFLVPRLSGIIELPISPLIMTIVLGGLLGMAWFLGIVSGLLAVGRFLGRK